MLSSVAMQNPPSPEAYATLVNAIESHCPKCLLDLEAFSPFPPPNKKDPSESKVSMPNDKQRFHQPHPAAGYDRHHMPLITFDLPKCPKGSGRVLKGVGPVCFLGNGYDARICQGGLLNVFSKGRDVIVGLHYCAFKHCSRPHQVP